MTFSKCYPGSICTNYLPMLYRTTGQPCICSVDFKPCKPADLGQLQDNIKKDGKRLLFNFSPWILSMAVMVPLQQMLGLLFLFFSNTYQPTAQVVDREAGRKIKS